MSNTTNTTKTTKIVKEIDYNCKGIIGTEKIFLDSFASINFEASEDYPLYKSEINIGNKTFDIYVKFNVGRRTTNYMHTIVSVDGSRVSLGFTSYVGNVKKLINTYIARALNA